MSTLDHAPELAENQTRTATAGWGPPWAGALAALPVFLVLQLLFYAFGWLDLGGHASGGGSSLVSAVLGIVALLVGGFAVGMTSTGDRARVTQQAALAWALTVVGVLVLGLVGGGALLGDVVSVAQGISAGGATPAADPAIVVATRTTAAWAALWLGVSLVAALVGALATPRTRR